MRRPIRRKRATNTNQPTADSRCGSMNLRHACTPGKRMLTGERSRGRRSSSEPSIIVGRQSRWTMTQQESGMSAEEERLETPSWLVPVFDRFERVGYFEDYDIAGHISEAIAK